MVPTATGGGGGGSHLLPAGLSDAFRGTLLAPESELNPQQVTTRIPLGGAGPGPWGRGGPHEMGEGAEPPKGNASGSRKATFGSLMLPASMQTRLTQSDQMQLKWSVK